MNGPPPTICSRGFCAPDCDHGPVDAEEVEACRFFLSVYATPRRTMNPRLGSYSLKHIVERVFRWYVSNGALIVAAIQEGYDVAPISPGCPNARINLSLSRTSELAALREVA